MYRTLLFFSLILISATSLCAAESEPDPNQSLVGQERTGEEDFATQLEQTLPDIPEAQHEEYLELKLPLYTWLTAQKHPLYHRTTTYLERAVFGNNISLLRLYKHYGACLSDRNEYGHTLLHQLILSTFNPDAPLASYPVIAIVKNLLDLGVQTQIGDTYNTLPYYYAVVVKQELWKYNVTLCTRHKILFEEIRQLQAKPCHTQTMGLIETITKRNQLTTLETMLYFNNQKRLALYELLPMLSPNAKNQTSAATFDTPSDKSSS